MTWRPRTRCACIAWSRTRWPRRPPSRRSRCSCSSTGTSPTAAPLAMTSPTSTWRPPAGAKVQRSQLMPLELPHVEPGDLITAADFNALARAIEELQVDVDVLIEESGALVIHQVV